MRRPLLRWTKGPDRDHSAPLVPAQDLGLLGLGQLDPDPDPVPAHVLARAPEPGAIAALDRAAHSPWDADLDRGHDLVRDTRQDLELGPVDPNRVQVHGALPGLNLHRGQPVRSEQVRDLGRDGFDFGLVRWT